MKHNIFLKTLAIFLCAASLMGIVGGTAGALALVERDLYNKTVDQVLQQHVQQLATEGANHLASRYADLILGGIPSEISRSFGNDLLSQNFSAFGYAILDAEGNKTGAYYLADEHFCPETCRKEVIMVDYSRVIATEEVVVKDFYALLSIYDGLEDPFCQLHRPEEPDPSEDPPLPDGSGETGEIDPGMTGDAPEIDVPGDPQESETIPSGNSPEVE